MGFHFLINMQVILWFTNTDLRVRDNQALSVALQLVSESQNAFITPVYVFDPLFMTAQTKFQTKKCGIHRAQFLTDAVEELRASLQDIGGRLQIASGKTEEKIKELIRAEKVIIVFSGHVCWEERSVEHRVA